MEYRYDYDDDTIFQNEYQRHRRVPMIHLDFEDEYLPKMNFNSKLDITQRRLSRSLFLLL